MKSTFLSINKNIQFQFRGKCDMNQSFQQLNDTFNVDCDDIDLNDDLKETE